MAKKPAGETTTPAPTFSVGDRVDILHFGPGEVIGIPGPLGPGGALVYRVAYRLKPRVMYLEVLGSQLRPTRVGQELGGGPPAGRHAGTGSESR